MKRVGSTYPLRGDAQGAQRARPGSRNGARAHRGEAGRAAGGDPGVFDDVERAISDIAAGRPVVVADDASRENEGDVIFAACKATPELLAFTICHARGLICAPMLGEDLDRLQLPQMTSENTEHMRTAFTVSVDAREGITTGISAADRARTIRLLADMASMPGDFVRPGHVFPLRYAEGGVLRRPGHTEAAVDLARLAGLTPAGVVAEVVNDDGTMARLPQLREFATRHGLALISVAQLIGYRRRTERTVSRVARTRLPNAYGEWQAFGYLNPVDGTEYVALVLGGVGDGTGVLTRVHSECLTGDVLGSLRCDCGAQLDAAMAAIAAEGRGVVLYMRGHEGRGIGLMSKLRAYQLQDAGADTVDANVELGLPVDARDYSAGAQILADLGVRSVRLLTNNPAKVAGLAAYGTEVAGRVPLPVPVTSHNLRYLTAKRDRLGHRIDNLPEPDGRPGSAVRLPASDHGPFEPVRAAGARGDGGDHVRAGGQHEHRRQQVPAPAGSARHVEQESA
ncbi:MAG TPA: bifunctional 3,4-dihydroxy-2-butanone-4-phosphate synthase/GTP cyclohydrolase II [Streptosporangiaceae bacterium]|nr:bifunctional 3,4-dihydroxy-2-butanone-4-phosphate synthase/GTP cyclohydrolase II [Streptosporangiaceae bacterium]